MHDVPRSVLVHCSNPIASKSVKNARLTKRKEEVDLRIAEVLQGSERLDEMYVKFCPEPLVRVGVRRRCHFLSISGALPACSSFDPQRAASGQGSPERQPKKCDHSPHQHCG